MILESDGDLHTFSAFAWSENSRGSTIQAWEADGADGCGLAESPGDYTGMIMRVLMYGAPSAGDVVQIQAPAPPAGSKYTAEVLIDDSASGTTLLSQADGSDYEIRDITSGGELIIDSFNVNLDDGSFILPATVKTCYCDAVGDVPDPVRAAAKAVAKARAKKAKAKAKAENRREALSDLGEDLEWALNLALMGDAWGPSLARRLEREAMTVLRRHGHTAGRVRVEKDRTGVAVHIEIPKGRLASNESSFAWAIKMTPKDTPEGTLRQRWDRDGHLWVGGALAAMWVLFQLDAPIVEDSLFWWIPKSLLAAELGPQLAYAHAMPETIVQGLTLQTVPPQWSGGLPDYGHPPLWFWYMAVFLRVSATVTAIHRLFGTRHHGGRRICGSRCPHWSSLVRIGRFVFHPVLAQLLRPELDLPLLAVVPWALLAPHSETMGPICLLGRIRCMDQRARCAVGRPRYIQGPSGTKNSS